MTLRINDGSGAAKIARNVSFFGTDGARKIVARISVNDASGAPRLFYRAQVAVAVSPAAVSAYRNGFGQATTSPVKANVSYGAPPFSYAWALIEGSGTATAPTSAMTSFTGIATPEGTEAAFQVTVTDAAGLTATAQASATFYRTGTGGGGLPEQ